MSPTLPGPDSSNVDKDSLLASSPEASGEELARIAQSRPDLHILLASNPATYPALLDWLAAHSAPEVKAAVAARKNGNAGQTLGNSGGKNTSTTGMKVLAFGGLAVTALLAVLVGAFFWLTPVAPSTFSAGPKDLRTVSSQVIGSELTLRPLNGHTAFVHVDQSRIVRMGGNESDLLVAIGPAGGSDYPVWFAPIPMTDEAPAECHLVGKSVQCGDTTVDTETGETTSNSNATVAAEVESPDQNNPAHAPLRVEAQPSDELPLSAQGSELINSKGRPIPGVQVSTDSSVWAVQVSTRTSFAGRVLPGSRTLWIVTTEAGLTTVTDSEVLWSIDLDAEERALNVDRATGQPVWVAQDDVVVLATKGGLRGVSTTSGEDLWRIDAPVTSWLRSGSDFIVTTDDTVTVVEMPTSVDEMARVPGQGGTASVNATTINPPQVPTLPTMAELGNSTVPVPNDCAKIAKLGDGDHAPTVSLTDGKASAPGVGYAGLELRSADTTLVDGEPGLLLRFYCFAGGDLHFESLGFYSPDMALLDRVELWGDTTWGTNPTVFLEGEVAEPNFSNLRMVGRNLSFTTEYIKIYGDHPHHGGQGTMSADVTLKWQDGSFVLADVLYHTPRGEVRPPEPATVQEIYDAVVAGREDEYADQISPELMEQIKAPEREVAPGRKVWWREYFFTPGSTVAGCVMATPAIDGGDNARGTLRFQARLNGELQPFSILLRTKLQPGQFVCSTPANNTPDAMNFEGMFKPYVIVSTDADGTVTMEYAEKSFWDMG